MSDKKMSDGGMGADHINIDQVESYLSLKETLVKTAILKIFTVDSALGETVTFDIFTVDSALRENKSLKMKSIEREIKPGEKTIATESSRLEKLRTFPQQPRSLSIRTSRASSSMRELHIYVGLRR